MLKLLSFIWSSPPRFHKTGCRIGLKHFWFYLLVIHLTIGTSLCVQTQKFTQLRIVEIKGQFNIWLYYLINIFFFEKLSHVLVNIVHVMQRFKTTFKCLYIHNIGYILSLVWRSVIIYCISVVVVFFSLCLYSNFNA